MPEQTRDPYREVGMGSKNPESKDPGSSKPSGEKGSPEKDVQHTSPQQQQPQFGPGLPRPGNVQPPAPKGGPGEGQQQSSSPAPGLPGKAPGEDTPIQYGTIGTTLKYTLSDVIAHEQAEAAGQDMPESLKDLPESAIEAAKKAGLIPVGTGDLGKVLRPDEAPAGKISSKGMYAKVSQKPMTPKEALAKYPGDSTTMKFPNPVHLTTDEHDWIFYPYGEHDVPNQLASHPYLKNCGARPVVIQQQPPEVIQQGTERWAPQRRP